MVEKYYSKYGQVAVIYSPGYGLGWSTEHDDAREFLAFDKQLAQLVEAEKYNEAEEYVRVILDGRYLGSAVKKLEIQWVNLGDRFLINNYDGSESVEILGPNNENIMTA
jgi:hypothetical protein